MEEFEKIKERAEGIIENPEALKEEYSKDSKTGLYLIANYLVQKYHFKTLAGKVKKFDELFIYQEGIFESGKADKIIREELIKILDKDFSDWVFNTVKAHITALTYFEGERKDFEEKDVNLLCFKNGILNLKNKEWTSHSPKHVFLSKVPVEYNPEADCPKIKKFINEVFSPEDVPVIQEFIGYLLYRKNIFKKALFLLGEKNTGKSTFIELLRNFVGEKNSTSISLQDICNSKFALADLEGKLLNFFPDLKYVATNDVGAFKMVSGNDVISGDVKFGERKIFYNYSKSVFSANQVPETKNESIDEAFYIRWLLITCENSFSEDKRDTDLINKITTDEELSGLLNWSLEGLDRLLENQRFSYSLDLDEVRNRMERSSNVVKCFADDELLKGDYSESITKSFLFEQFINYTKRKGKNAITDKKFSRDIKVFAPYIEEGWIGKKKAWRNVKWKNPEKIIENEKKILEIE